MFDSKATAAKIQAIIEKEFQPLEFSLEDQSHFHKGHKQAGGGGHFFVTIKSARFTGIAPLARQRMVLDAMGSLMDKEVHALSMKCVPA
jgi:BolA protein